jgi:hypothetical protein
MDERELGWFSACLRRVCVIEGAGAVDAWDEVFLLRAEDRDEAFTRALEIGRDREETYVNADGESVLWLFAEVVTLDEVRTNHLDGVEVYCSVTSVPTGSKKVSDHVFKPEESTPGSTGI